MRFISASLMIAMLLASTGCAGLTDRQQRVLTGGAMGAAGGAAVGALSGGSAGTGAILGGAAGAAGGLIVDEMERKKNR